MSDLNKENLTNNETPVMSGFDKIKNFLENIADVDQDIDTVDYKESTEEPAPIKEEVVETIEVKTIQTKDNSLKEEVAEIKKQVKSLEELGVHNASKRKEVLEQLDKTYNAVLAQLMNEKITAEEEMLCNGLIEDIESAIDKVERKHKSIIGWFKKHPKITTTAIAVGLIALIGTKPACDMCQEYKAEKTLEEAGKDLEKIANSDATLAKIEEIGKAAQNKALQAETEEKTKEEQIMELVKELTTEFNKFEGLNVTEEQVLSLFIHLNVGNSYTNENTLALDKLTREDLVKKYYVGLTPNTEEFENYEIEDDDLAKLSTASMELRNELVNYVYILNDQGKYEESRKILEILNKFITEEELQDEAMTLIDNAKSIQTKDEKEIKKRAYLWYNYLYAGPKQEVRNFSDYGYWHDADGKVMTFENQGMTIRFLTWFLSAFMDININNGLDIIPQDIVNDAQAKLLDQSNLFRALGYKNCSAFGSIYDSLNFDLPIANRNVKKSSGTGRGKATKATGNEQLDTEIDQFLQQNQTVGSSTTTSDGSTVTIVESGPNSTTVEVQPDSGSATTEDTTPAGPGSTEIVEGGGNETVEEIFFPEDDSNEIIIEEGGDLISSSSSSAEVPVEQSAEQESTPVEQSVESAPVEQTVEEPAEESTTEDVASIRDEINALLEIRNLFTDYTVTIEEPTYQKTYSC